MTADQTTEAAGAHTPRFGMVVDVNRCVGCQTCTISCKHTNDTPPGVQWRRVLDVEQGTFPDVERLFLVVGCQHCAEPPCVPVCPTGATKQREDGLVTMDYDTCIGCGYCAVACPYQARTIGHDKNWFYDEPTAQEQAVRHEERDGVANKCTFCVEKIDDAKERGLTPGVDLEVTPACSASCIAQAIHFGDFADPASNVSGLARDNAFFQMHEELGTDPQIKYLYEVQNATPGRDPGPDDLNDTVMSDSENALVGPRQTYWDLRAAMNFTLGGMSTGLVIVAVIAYLIGVASGTEQPFRLSEPRLVTLLFIAGIGMAIGLFFVFLEIGRKLRFMRVLLRWQTSWMTRETYAVAVFYPALLADLIWPHMALHILVAFAAAAFLFCQGRILHAGRGIPTWRQPLMPWMLIASGLYEGLGLLAISLQFVRESAKTDFTTSFIVLTGIAVLALVNAGLWTTYCLRARAGGVGPLSLRILGTISPYLYGAGYAVPFVCVVAAGYTASEAAATVLLGIAGVGAVAGGVLWKVTVITRACHQQGYAIPKMPRRGSGDRAAPARTQSI